MRIEVLEQVWTKWKGDDELGFQWCRYPFKDGAQNGYRFMWRSPRGLHPDRGQALIPSAAVMFKLIQEASRKGWFVEVERRTRKK
jgi:hypothetical protein